MANFISRFAFTGDIYVPKSGAKRPFYKETTVGKDKRAARSLNFGVKADENNMAFVECFDSVQEDIKTMDTEKNKIEIAWRDRLDEDVVAMVAGFKKYTVDLGDDHGGRQEFVASYDFIEFLHNTLPEFKGRVLVTGQFSKNWVEGKNGGEGQYYDHFRVQNVYAANEDSKNRLALTMDIFYNRDCIDTGDWKSEQKIYVNGYIPQYINKDEGTKYVPQSFVFSAAKYDPDNEQHQKLLKYKLGYIQTKSKTMVHIPWDLVLLRGAEEEEFTAEMLTPAQKEQVELGIKSVEDFKPRGSIVGGRINEYRLFDPKLIGDFSEGMIDTELSFTEFEEDVYTPVADEKLDDVMKAAKTSKTTKAAKPKNDEPPFDTDDLDTESLF